MDDEEYYNKRLMDRMKIYSIHALMCRGVVDEIYFTNHNKHYETP